MNNSDGPMDRVLHGLESGTEKDLAGLKEEARSLGIDPDSVVARLQGQVNAHLKQIRMSWRSSALQKKANFESKALTKRSWKLRTPDEIDSEFSKLIQNPDLALAFRNRQGALSFEDKAQILDDVDAVREESPKSEDS